MANIPVLWALIALSAIECILNISLFPKVFPGTHLTTLFFLFMGANISIWVFWKVLIYPSWFSPFRHLPQPKSTNPITGHGSVLYERPAGSAFLRFMNEIPNEGLIRFPGFFNLDWLLLTDPTSLAEVLVHKSYDFQKPDQIRKFLSIILGEGLIVVEGDEHRFQRKHLTPAFSFRHIKDLYPIFWSKAVELKDRITAEIYENPEYSRFETKNSPKGVVEINHWASKATMDIIGVAGLGRDFNALKNSDDELLKNYEEILEPTNEKGLYFVANTFLGRRFVSMLPWKLNQRLEATTSALKAFCHQLIRDKKVMAKTEKGNHVDILSLLIKSNDFADSNLVDQLLTFLAAGHETTSAAFTWSTYLIAIHPEIQSRLREEIYSHLPPPSSPLDPSVDLATILESMPLLNGVCNEVLRLYPTVPVTVRMSIRPTTILSQHIPKGTRIYISPWAINRSSKLWGPTATEFHPERWVDSDTGKPNNNGGVSSNYSIMTFLHGPRSCIGEKFAKSELRALIAVFVGCFEMEMADPNEVPEPAGAITTKPKNGLKLRLKALGDW